MGDLFLSGERHKARGDDRREVSGIVHVIRNGLPGKDAPAGCGSHKTPCNRFIHWSRMGCSE